MNSKTIEIGVILNGVTGRMGTNQHLIRSLLAIQKQGGVKDKSGSTILPKVLLLGRNADKLASLAREAGGLPWTTDLDSALGDPGYSVYFDAQTTDRRVEGVRRAIASGKHIYCEKPTALNLAQALELWHLAEAAGVKHGVVQDKLWLPGLIKLRRIIRSGALGKILSVRGEFGYWVFPGDDVPAQRPSWNYRKEDGGGIILDMFCHWRYLIDNLAGEIRSLSCLGATHLAQRWDERGQRYDCTADDAAYGTFLLEGGVVAQFNSSWCVRVRRDDLFTVQVDGLSASAVAGLRSCFIQPAQGTPRPVWNPDIAEKTDFSRHWLEVPETEPYDNAFKIQWELFLKHVASGEPFRWNLLEGAKGVQLAELGYESWRERRWVEVLPLAGERP